MYYESFGHDFRINKCTKDMYVCHDIGFNYQRREIWPLVYTWIPCHLGALRAKRKSMLDFPKKNVVMVGRKHIIFIFFLYHPYSNRVKVLIFIWTYFYAGKCGNPVWFGGWFVGYCGRRLRPQLDLIFRLNVWFDFYISIFCSLCIC